MSWTNWDKDTFSAESDSDDEVQISSQEKSKKQPKVEAADTVPSVQKKSWRKELDEFSYVMDAFAIADVLDGAAKSESISCRSRDILGDVSLGFVQSCFEICSENLQHSAICLPVSGSRSGIRWSDDNHERCELNSVFYHFLELYRTVYWFI